MAHPTAVSSGDRSGREGWFGSGGARPGRRPEHPFVHEHPNHSTQSRSEQAFRMPAWPMVYRAWRRGPTTPTRSRTSMERVTRGERQSASCDAVAAERARENDPPPVACCRVPAAVPDSFRPPRARAVQQRSFRAAPRGAVARQPQTLARVAERCPPPGLGRSRYRRPRAPSPRPSRQTRTASSRWPRPRPVRARRPRRRCRAPDASARAPRRADPGSGHRRNERASARCRRRSAS